MSRRAPTIIEVTSQQFDELLERAASNTLRDDDYPGADQVDVSHPELSPGDACPERVQGTLYEKTPGVLVRF